MRHFLRVPSAVLFCAALSSAAAADPAADPSKPAVTPQAAAAPAPAAPGAPVPAALKPVAPKPVAAAAPGVHPAARPVHAALSKHRAAFRHHLVRLHDRAPIRLAALDPLPPVRPARLIDMTAQRDGVVVRPETVQVARPTSQSSSCDSLLCSSYIILGAGF